MKTNLQDAIKAKIDTLGPKAAAEFFGVKSALIARWVSGDAIPSAAAAQLVLDEMDDSEEIKRLMARVAHLESQPAAASEPVKPPKSNIAILVPTNRAIDLASVMSILGSWKNTLPAEIKGMLATLDGKKDTLIHTARNVLATQFLAGSAEWSFWHDSDMVLPIGNAAWFKAKTSSRNVESAYAGASAIEKLTSYKDRGIISGVYVARDGSGRIVAHCGMTKGEEQPVVPSGGIIPQPWVGFGCVAVHRRVFLDIIEKCEDVKPTGDGQPYRFFSPIAGHDCSEDIAFCKRAKDAGHTAYLDLSIVCGHIGNHAFLPEHVK